MEKKRSKEAAKERDDEDSTVWWWVVHKGITPTFFCISLFALLVRVSVSLHPYSGAGNPPMYGDYEAQRHWMEITTNLPPKEWYRNGTDNDLSYWGLDYPPLTAYQSYIHGLFLKFFDPDSVLLYTSRGYESYRGKLLMRWTVLSSDALVFFPAVLYFVFVYYSGRSGGRKSDIAWHIAMILINPCLILIDHGHFQYNCISLGLTVGAVAAILSNKDLVASFLFTLALNHKQMSMYFAPAFFSHLLGKRLRCQNPLLEVSKLGVVVLATFAMVWWPYLHSIDSVLEGSTCCTFLSVLVIQFFILAIHKILSRLAPFERGIYEDYVANFWCTTSVLVKWKRLFSTQSLKLLSFAATVSACLPSMVQQLWAPSNRGFLFGLLNSAFAFYLFSFQVHEKSILLPLLPASFLATEEPFLFQWLTQYALLSMFPLLCRDKLVLPYIALYGLFILLYYTPGGRQNSRKAYSSGNLRLLVISLSVLCSLVLHIIYMTLLPPEKYPFVFEAVIMLLCFSQFLLVVVNSNKKQWMLLRGSPTTNREKKYI